MLRSKKIGIVGVGNMGGALAKGLLEGHVIPPENLYLSDKDGEKLRNLSSELGAKGVETPELIQSSDVVILAIKPQDMEAFLREYGPLFQSKQLLISIAAGITTEFIERHLENKVPVIRVMPNLPVIKRAGASAYSLGSYASWPHGVVTSLIFSAVGLIVEVAEEQMDAVTALSGTGPAYVFLLAEMMTEAGAKEGLPEDIAGYLAVQTIWGSAQMMIDSEKSPRELRQAVTSPNGTTEAAMKILNTDEFKGLFAKGVGAARKRSAELSEGK